MFLVSRSGLSPDLMSEKVEKMHSIPTRSMRSCYQACTFASPAAVPQGLSRSRHQATSFCQKMRDVGPQCTLAQPKAEFRPVDGQV